MHVLVATDGHLDAAAVAKFSAPLAGPDGKVTVLTVIEVPRAMLQELQDHFSDQPPPKLRMEDPETVTADPPEAPRSWPGDDAIIEQYLQSKRFDICEPLVSALRQTGVTAASMVVEGPADKGILSTAKQLSADVIVIGPRGMGFFEGLLGSTGTKVTRLAKRPVLLLRNADS
jgi:nucleotide-binding universal stress UspA family protein